MSHLKARNIRTSTISTARSAVGNAFDAAKDHEHELYSNSFPADNSQATSAFMGYIEGIRINLSSISGASEITMRVCFDGDGDEVFIPDTTASISTGITTSTVGSVAYSVKIPVRHETADGKSLYVFFKTNAGTVTVNESIINWS